jgi:hypothetical protein
MRVIIHDKDASHHVHSSSERAVCLLGKPPI